MLCVTIRHVRFDSLTILSVSSVTFSAVAGSRAAVCSSSSRSLGGFTVAISSVSAWRCPPDSSPTGCFIRSSSPISNCASLSRKNSRSCRDIVPNHPPLPEASARFSSMVMPGAVPLMGSWNRWPMAAALLCMGSQVMSLPSRVMVPLSG